MQRPLAEQFGPNISAADREWLEYVERALSRPYLPPRAGETLVGMHCRLLANQMMADIGKPVWDGR